MKQFKVGDKVKIVWYGNIQWQSKKQWAAMYEVELTDDLKPKNILHEDEEYWYIDSCPEMVGQVGIITHVYKDEYALNGVRGKSAWYGYRQLEFANFNEIRRFFRSVVTL